MRIQAPRLPSAEIVRHVQALHVRARTLVKDSRLLLEASGVLKRKGDEAIKVSQQAKLQAAQIR
jgi:hypothetical protein